MKYLWWCPLPSYDCLAVLVLVLVHAYTIMPEISKKSIGTAGSQIIRPPPSNGNMVTVVRRYFQRHRKHPANAAGPFHFEPEGVRVRTTRIALISKLGQILKSSSAHLIAKKWVPRYRIRMRNSSSTAPFYSTLLY